MNIISARSKTNGVIGISILEKGLLSIIGYGYDSVAVGFDEIGFAF
jgi:hypothetical protein